MDEGNQALATAVEERFGVRAHDARGVRSRDPAPARPSTRQRWRSASTSPMHKITDRMLAMEDRIVETRRHQDRRPGGDDRPHRFGLRRSDRRAVAAHARAGEQPRTSPICTSTSSPSRSSKVDEQGHRTASRSSCRLPSVRRCSCGSKSTAWRPRTDEKLDKTHLRMAEIEGLLGDEMDVSAAVQLERLDELERAIVGARPRSVRAQDRPASWRTRTATARQAAHRVPTRDPTLHTGSRPTHRSRAFRRSDDRPTRPGGDGHHGNFQRHPKTRRRCAPRASPRPNA